MSRSLEELTDLVASATETILEKVEPLPSDLLSRSPGHSGWSVLQILDHLNKTHELTLPRFEEALSRSPSIEQGDRRPLKYSLMERAFLRMVGPNPPFKSAVPKPFVPEAAPEREATFKRFLAFQERLRACLLEASVRQTHEAVVESPVMSRLRLRLDTYLEAIVMHEQYHLGQIRDLLDATAPGGLKASAT